MNFNKLLIKIFINNNKLINKILINSNSKQHAFVIRI